VPVVSTTHADIPYITVPGASALLSPEGDSASLATDLMELAMHPGLGHQLGEAGRDHVKHYHNAPQEVASLEERYLQLAG
jgi:hypothetical protein